VVFLADADATHRAGVIVSSHAKLGDVIALSGDLGAGKTSFARGFLKGLGLIDEAPSPSFPLVIPYAPPETRLAVWHVDLYRLDDPEQAEELGLDEARDDAILLIEWPERLGDRLWPDALQLRFETKGVGRRLTASLPPSWEARWPFQ
jgi:tRNA threonylcarbamoyladenosine biosynthesis protein TsaE